MAPAPLLPFQRRVLDELLDEDALCVVARGLGLNRILAELARVCATPRALVFLVNCSEQDEDDLQHHFMQMRSGENANEATELRIVKNETNATARGQLYRRGGLISVTSRILIVDLLNEVVPVELVTGVIVHNASRITAESIEAFVLRIVRQTNPSAFVKALSDAPEAFTLGFAPLEKTLKVLGLRHVHLWPRFHVDIQRDLSADSAPVIELRLPQTRSMVELQQAVLDCLSATIGELCSSTKALDPETVNVESSLFRYFDAMVKRQLSPYWHRLSARVRNMADDLTLLRRVAELITAYDPVSLLEYLDALLLSSKPTPGGLPGPAASWMASDSANILYAVARTRTFRKVPREQLPQQTRERLVSLGLPDTIVPVLEVPPKLEILAQVLEEIGVANSAAAGQNAAAGPVLVMAGSGRECRMIRAYLASLHSHVEFDVPQPDGDGGATAERHPRMMVDMLRGFFRWKAQAAGIRAGGGASQQTGPGTAGHDSAGRLRRAPPAKRRRVRGASSAGLRFPRAPAEALEQEASDLAAEVAALQEEPDSAHDAGFGVHESTGASLDAPGGGAGYLDDDDEWADALCAFDENFGLLSSSETVVVHPYSNSKGVLQALLPTHVVMYAPYPAFIREVEAYQARGAPLKQVYFLVYDNSLEEQRYLSAIRRERESFERLIREKATLVIPVNDGNVGAQAAASPANMLLRAVAARSHRNARSVPGMDDAPQQPRVVVDVREFRSPLPSLLHASGFEVIPRTIDVGDYVLHDNLVVERKSLPDLIGSLRSGRLFNQADAMTRHYSYAALLIEFEVNTSFSLQAIGGLSSDIAVNSVTSQLTMLVLAFPRLRVIWSSSPYETVSIFAELKQGALEPSIDRAVAVGQDDASVEREGVYSQAPIALLQSLPGVTLKNYQALARAYRNVRELAAASQPDLAEILGADAAQRLHGFFRSKAK
ncbi:DNA repair protein RAD16 [Coemansia biformis]|uniref:DNA repair protein RAD16 n=1 Tax=Coemansia biformis TaxID=1286918 RepID=A0A9W7Y8P7_9FUNG|nr:DNA repair protein RAD16 [Coemansia biformis]